MFIEPSASINNRQVNPFPVYNRTRVYGSQGVRSCVCVPGRGPGPAGGPAEGGGGGGGGQRRGPETTHPVAEQPAGVPRR